MGRVRGEVRPKFDARRDIEIAYLYVSGLKFREICERMGISKNAVSRALDRTNCPRRSRGVPPKIINVDRRSKYPHESSIPTFRPAPKRVWCGQCERNVVTAEAERCSSQWCKAKQANGTTMNDSSPTGFLDRQSVSASRMGA